MAIWRDILKEKDDKKVVDTINEDFRESQDARNSKNQEFLNHLKVFHLVGLEDDLSTVPFASSDDGRESLRNMMYSEGEPIRNTFYPPWARAMILTAWAKITTALIPNRDKFVGVEPVDLGDRETADNWQSVAHELYRQISYADEVSLAVITALLADACVMFTGWKVRPAAIPIIHSKSDPQTEVEEFLRTGEFPKQNKFEFQIKADGISLPDYRVINPFNMRPDPNMSHGQFDDANALYFGVTAKVPKNVIYRMVENKQFSECEITSGGKLKIGKIVVEDDEACDANEITNDHEAVLKSDLNAPNAEENLESGSENHFRVDYYYQQFNVVIVINKKYLAHKRQTIGWPFIKVVTYENLGMFSGSPLMRDLMHIQFDITSMIRQRRNRQDNAAYPRPMIDADQFSSLEEAEDALNGDPDTPIIYHGMRAMGKIEPIKYLINNTPQDDTAIETQTEMRWGEMVAGFTDNSTGADRPGNRSATEAKLMDMGMTTRLQKVVGDMSAGLIEKATYNLYNLTLMHLQGPIAVAIAGADGLKYRELGKEAFMFAKPPKIRALGPTSVSEQAADLDKFMEGLKIVTQLPQFAQRLKVVPIMRELFTKLGVDTPEALLTLEDGGEWQPSPGQEIMLMAMGAQAPITMPMAATANERLMAIQQFIQTPRFSKLEDAVKGQIMQRARDYFQIKQQSMGGGKPLAGATPDQERPGPSPTAPNNSMASVNSAPMPGQTGPGSGVGAAGPIPGGGG
ncbi:MAG: hypothetical protein KKB31_07480 [Nanoarchaeota archaeon]|nr:hypothetical protein [Nanoarchaeota archaeon]